MYLITSSLDEGSLKMWDAEGLFDSADSSLLPLSSNLQESVLQRPTPRAIFNVDVLNVTTNALGTRLAYLYNDVAEGTTIQLMQYQRKIGIVDIASCNVVNILQGHSFMGIHLNSTGLQLVSCAKGAGGLFLGVWSTDNGEMLSAVTSLPVAITAFTFAPDDSSILVSASYGVISIWNINAGSSGFADGQSLELNSERQLVGGPRRAVDRITASKNIVCGSAYKSLSVWNLDTMTLVASLELDSVICGRPCFGDDVEVLVPLTSGIIVLNGHSGIILRHIPTETAVVAATFDKVGRRIIAAIKDNASLYFCDATAESSVEDSLRSISGLHNDHITDVISAGACAILL
jgi:WD40 repeat protein